MSAFRRFLNSSEKNTTSKSRDRSVWRQRITEQNTDSETWYRYPWQCISGRSRHMGGFILPEVKAFFRENKARCNRSFSVFSFKTLRDCSFFLDPSSWKLETAGQTSSDEGRISDQTVETSCFRRQGWTTKKGNILFSWLWLLTLYCEHSFFSSKTHDASSDVARHEKRGCNSFTWMNPTYSEEKLIGL